MNACKFHRGLFEWWEQPRKYGKISVAFESFSPPKAQDAAELTRCSYCGTLASSSTLPEATCSASALYMQAGDLPKQIASGFVSRFSHLLLSFGEQWYTSCLHDTETLVLCWWNELSCMDIVALFISEDVEQWMLIFILSTDNFWETYQLS